MWKENKHWNIMVMFQLSNTVFMFQNAIYSVNCVRCILCAKKEEENKHSIDRRQFLILTGGSYQASLSTYSNSGMPKQPATFIRVVDPAYSPSTTTPTYSPSTAAPTVSVTYNRPPEPYQQHGRQVPEPAVYPPTSSKQAPPPSTYSSDVYVPPSLTGSSGYQPQSPTSRQQERHDYEDPIPQHTYQSAEPSSERYPQGAPSRVMHSTAPGTTGLAQSRPMGPGSKGGYRPPGAASGGYGAAASMQGTGPGYQPQYRAEPGKWTCHDVSWQVSSLSYMQPVKSQNLKGFLLMPKTDIHFAHCKPSNENNHLFTQCTMM